MPSLLDQRRAVLDAAANIVNSAKAQGRSDLTPAESKSVQDRLAEVDQPLSDRETTRSARP